MLMRGDLETITNKINPVFENAFSQIEELRKRMESLEAELQKSKVSPASKTKAKSAAEEG